MWNKIARLIIQYRLTLMLLIGLITIVMGFYASKVQMSYDANRTVPPKDPDMIMYQQFKEQFGEDGNTIAIGIKDSAIYKLENFEAYRTLARNLKQISGVNEVIALPVLKTILKDTENSRFYFANIFPDRIRSTEQFDSLLRFTLNQQFWKRLVNQDNGAVVMLVLVNKDVMNSSLRDALTASLSEAGEAFEKKTGIELHFAGMPYIRAVVATQVKKEMQLFLAASALITGLIMFLFFRSVRAVMFSMIMIAIVVVWTLGTLALLGFKITLLSGLIPPVMVTIGITNAIYLLNKYHLEFARTNDKLEAITTVVKKMGLATFLTNLTVAIGFLTLLATDITILREFGIVAGINIIALFFISLVMIPSIFSWLPIPSERHLRHLNFRIMGKFLKVIDVTVHRHRLPIYVVSAALAVVSVYGMSKLRSLSFVVDDVPEDSRVKRDLKFIEENFGGFMPLEITVEFKTKKRQPLRDVNNLRKVEAFENFLDSLPEVSKPVSLISFVKAARQAFYNNNPERYGLPSSNSEANFILKYMKNQSDNSGLVNSYVDSKLTKMRISCQIADIGSVKLDSLVTYTIEPKMKALFVPVKKDTIATAITGSTKIFIKGTKFLIANLQESLTLAFLLITISMAALFANVRMIIISLIPNLLALTITAGIMGYLDIPLKPSTALIFSITFGISVDNSIRFLAKYRQEILTNNFFIPVAVSDSIMETGKAIMYTSIVLFAGFSIFALSDFGYNIALGLLTSTTLVISMFTNLILLPALIMTFDKPKRRKDEHMLIDELGSSYSELDDEEIDLEKIKIHNRHSAAE